MAHIKLLSWFRLRRTIASNDLTPKQKVFQVARAGDAVLLDKFLQKLDCTERLSAVNDHTYNRRRLGRTPLIIAAVNGNLDCVKVLLKFKADIGGRGDFTNDYTECPRPLPHEQCTPLFFAAGGGKVEILSCLLENGADINAMKNIHGFTPLMMAARYNHLAAVTFLMDQGADANLQDKKGYTALHYVAMCGSSCSFNVINCLIDNGADVNIQSAVDNLTPLMLACKCRNVYVVNYLLQSGGNVGLHDRYGQTCLQYTVKRAVDETAFEILSSLIKNGSDVNSRIDNDGTLLMLVTWHGDLKMVSFLIDHGANVNLQDQNGDTALHYTERRFVCATPKIVCALLTAGASLLFNNQGLTPLLATSNRGNRNVRMVECLIKQQKITKEQRIDALELLGASLCLESASYPDVSILKRRFVQRDEALEEGASLEKDSWWKVVEGFKYIQRGMNERFINPSYPLLKRPMDPVEAYQNRKESQTPTELAEIEGGRDAIIMESLRVRERILGTNNAELLRSIKHIARYYEKHDFSTSIALYSHAIKVMQRCNQDVLFGLREMIMKVWHRYRWLDVVEYGTFKRFDKIVFDYEHDSLMRLGCTFVCMISKFNCSEECKLCAALCLKTLCNFNPRDCPGNTLLHHFVIDQRRFLWSLSSDLPVYTSAMKLLLNAGFNVNAINNRGDTPLHLAVSIEPWGDDNTHPLTDTLVFLFDGGAHHDFVNNDGKTPMDMAKTDEARMILSKRRKLELKCISAKAVKMFGIPYMGVVPKTMEKYISMH